MKNVSNLDMKKVVDVAITGFGICSFGEFLLGFMVEPSGFTSGILFAVACAACIKKLNN